VKTRKLLKRTGFARTRRAPLATKTPIKPRNAKRLAKRRAEQFGPQADLCRCSPCVACLTMDRTVTQDEVIETLILTIGFGSGSRPSRPHHHGKTRGAGGLDDRNLSLCDRHHDEAHTLGARFWKRHGLDPDAIVEVFRGAVKRARGVVVKGALQLIVGDEFSGHVAGEIR
jgi:hypothetical protein